MNRSSKFLSLVWAAAAVAAVSRAPLTSAETTVDSNTFGGVEARSIGPAAMSGRISAIDAVAKDPLTIYIGAASGGVWKSTDGGLAFKPIFDDHTQSIGAITIDPNDPKTVWVGTGESWTRNSVSVGTGVYKTTDGGETWKLAGLPNSERIARIRVDGKNSKVVFVCATGHLWNANEERGLYKTTDGGDTWKRVLYVDENTGCADVDGDPQDSNVLYAGMWQFRRSPDFFESGGKGSNLYRSLDGGETWQVISAGLPEGDKGRVAVAVAPSRPNVVYALVEAKKSALYRSDDLGTTFHQVNSSFNTIARPFYFSRLVVDPQDFNRVYKPGFNLGISEDGGKSFSGGFSFGGNVHPDHHALWVNPSNPAELLLGTDGGVYQSYDRGNNWRFIRSLPISQFYHVSYDMEFPYNVYGGLQDNGSWMGPSSSIGGIENADWKNVGQGDGFWVFRDTGDNDFVYSEFQGGNLSRVRLSNNESRDIKPQPKAGEPDFRFNWNTPMHLSANEPGTLYYGAQFLFRTRDHGQSWETISPDLTTNDPKLQRQKQSGGLSPENTSAEAHTTIYAISESPKNKDVIWVGTDDGNLQVTRDGGKTWTNVAAKVTGVPAGTWVSSVTASTYDQAAAFVTFDGHRRGDMKPYAYRTADFGQTWTSVTTDTVEGYAWVLKQDLVDPDLLFLGTEFGLYLSIDGGAEWARFTGGLPKVAVHDIAIHPREHDLILATHGRGVYILDDITPLRQLSAELVASEVALLPADPFVMPSTATMQGFSGGDEFVGRNPPEAVVITYYLKKRHVFGDLKVEIYDREGKLVSTIPGTKRKGLNRVEWPMRLPPPKVPPADSLAMAFIGPRVPEGEYTVKLIKGKETLSGKVQLVADPRSPHSAEDRDAQQKLSMYLYRKLEDMTFLIDTALAIRDQARERAKELPKGDKLTKSVEALAEAYEKLRGELVSSGEGGIFGSDEKLREHLSNLYAGVTAYDGRPTQTQQDRAVRLVGELDAAAARFKALEAGDLAKVNGALTKKGVKPITAKSRDEWEAAQKKG